jgi:hypothetical protein
MNFNKEEVRRRGRIGRRDGRNFRSPHGVLTRDRRDQRFLVTVTTVVTAIVSHENSTDSINAKSLPRLYV